MKPRRTHNSDTVWRLPGGTEDNDLWVTTYPPDSGGPALGSVWEPTDEEREAIANGANVELVIFAPVHPPVAMRLDETPLGKPPTADDERA